MRIEVIGKHMEVTDAIRAYATDKASKLTKHLDLIQQITVRVESATHKNTKTFHAEVVADVEHHDDFVGNADNADMYAAIDAACVKVARQLTDFKERLKQSKRGGGAAKA